MNETAGISFYQITECGFFKRGADRAEFGSIAELLHNLEAWGKGKHLVATKTFEPADGEDIHPAYLMDIRSRDNTWLITTWNQTPAHEAGVASVRGTSNVGRAEVVMNSVERGSIPGFATYFWFVPSAHVFASVRFQHLWTGQKSLQKYAESFLSSFSDHVVFGEEEDKVIVQGYAKNPATDSPEDLYPRFRTALVRKPGARDFIRQNRLRINKVIRKTMLKLDRAEDLSKWQSLIRWMHRQEPNLRPDRVRVQYELSGAVTDQDLDGIFADWDAGHESEWDDYGFMLRGEAGHPHWLSHTLAREKFPLEVVRNNDEVVNAESLLSALLSKRDEILNLIKR